MGRSFRRIINKALREIDFGAVARRSLVSIDEEVWRTTLSFSRSYLSWIEIWGGVMGPWSALLCGWACGFSRGTVGALRLSEFKRLEAFTGMKKVTFDVGIPALKLRGISACALLVFALSVFGFLSVAFAREIIMLCPERIFVGEPFLVTVYMESKPEGVELSWLGEVLSLDVRADGGHFVSAALWAQMS